MSNPATADVADTGVAAEELRQFIERLERMEEEAAAINADKKEIYAEAKGRGFDTKVMKQILAMRRKDQDELQEEEALLELYKQALGMS